MTELQQLSVSHVTLPSIGQDGDVHLPRTTKLSKESIIMSRCEVQSVQTFSGSSAAEEVHQIPRKHPNISCSEDAVCQTFTVKEEQRSRCWGRSTRNEHQTSGNLFFGLMRTNVKYLAPPAASLWDMEEMWWCFSQHWRLTQLTWLQQQPSGLRLVGSSSVFQQDNDLKNTSSYGGVMEGCITWPDWHNHLT